VIAVPLVPTYLLGLVILCWEVAARRKSLATTAPPVRLTDWLRSLLPEGAIAAGSIRTTDSISDAIDVSDGRAA
jgi:hypothetical protein